MVSSLRVLGLATSVSEETKELLEEGVQKIIQEWLREAIEYDDTIKLGQFVPVSFQDIPGKGLGDFTVVEIHILCSILTCSKTLMDKISRRLNAYFKNLLQGSLRRVRFEFVEIKYVLDT